MGPEVLNGIELENKVQRFYKMSHSLGQTMVDLIQKLYTFTLLMQMTTVIHHGCCSCPSTQHQTSVLLVMGWTKANANGCTEVK